MKEVANSLDKKMSEFVLEEDGYFKCQTCHKRFFSKYGFQIHFANEHITVTPSEKDKENENKEIVKKVKKELTQDTVEEKATTQSKLDFYINANKPEVCMIADVVFDKKNLKGMSLCCMKPLLVLLVLSLYLIT